MRSVVAVAKPVADQCSQLPCRKPVRNHQRLRAAIAARREQLQSAEAFGGLRLGHQQIANERRTFVRISSSPLVRTAGATGRKRLKALERVKGIEPSSSAWKAPENRSSPLKPGVANSQKSHKI